MNETDELCCIEQYCTTFSVVVQPIKYKSVFARGFVHFLFQLSELRVAEIFEASKVEYFVVGATFNEQSRYTYVELFEIVFSKMSKCINIRSLV